MKEPASGQAFIKYTVALTDAERKNRYSGDTFVVNLLKDGEINGETTYTVSLCKLNWDWKGGLPADCPHYVKYLTWDLAIIVALEGLRFALKEDT